MKSSLGRLPLLFVGVIALCALALVACGGDDDDGGGGQPTQPAGNPTSAPPQMFQMSMIDFGYNPATLSVVAGRQVRLSVTNDGDAPHTFTIDNLVDSGTMNADESEVVEFTATSAGTLTFYCTIHGQAAMSGQVTVTAQ